MMPTSRREFLKTAATASLIGTSSYALQSKKVGYCIVGLGRISLGQFMPGITNDPNPNSKIVALVSGHRDKAEQAAAKYGVDKKNIYDYEHYDEIARNPEIDAVYIALPNSMHAEYTIRAAKAGKHVLCEKPMANTAADCEQMVAACKKAGKKLMIAYRCQYHPQHLRSIQMIRDGKIGDLKMIEASFGFNIAKNEWRCSRTLAGGGPMMDVGIYALNACRYLTGEEPKQLSAVSSVSTQDGRFAEVEENLFWTMRFPSGVVTNCTTSYGSNCGNYFHAVGTKGWVRMDTAFSYDNNAIKAQLSDGTKIDEPVRDPNQIQFTREAQHFSSCVLEGKEPKSGGEEGLRDMRLIGAIYRSCAEAASRQVLL